MKVYLMHPDRDYDATRPLPPQSEMLAQDLELETLLSAMAPGDRFVNDIARHALLSGADGPEAVRYRQGILQDCLRHPQVIRALYEIPLTAIRERQKHWLGIFGHTPTAILSSALVMLEMFVGRLRELRQVADTHGTAFESPGFRRFFAMIQAELDDTFFAEVETHVRELRFRGGVLLSVDLGKGNEGTDYVLRKSNHQGQPWLRRVLATRSPAYSFSIHPRDEHGGRMLGELRDRGLNLVANAVAQSTDHIESFLTAMRVELSFYVACLNLSEKLSELGAPIAIPLVAPVGEIRHRAKGLYDPCLALTLNGPAVGSDLEADGKSLVFVTGANQGGKSTFLRSVGLAQLMMECGMFVGAEAFTANMCRGLFTHFKREEDASLKSGKLDEELARMSTIVDRLSSGCLVLFNESFAATNEREGSEIARQIVSALLERRITVFYVTHLYELAHGFFALGPETASFLRAEREADGTRTYRLLEGEPLQTSFGEDLYRTVFEQDGVPE
jgi:hypothetical protein